MPRARDGRRQLPSNTVYRAIQGAGGPKRICEVLGISLSTLARWRRVGRVTDACAALNWAALLRPEPTEQLAMARRLAGCDHRPGASQQKVRGAERT